MEQEALEGLEEYGEETQAFIAHVHIFLRLPQGVEASLALPPLRTLAYDQLRAVHKVSDLVQESGVNQLIRSFIASPPRPLETTPTQNQGVAWSPRPVPRDLREYSSAKHNIETLAASVSNLDELEREGFLITLFDLEGREIESFTG